MIAIGRPRPHHRWLDDGRLELQVWAHETTDYRIEERNPIAEWRDDVLRLEHITRQISAPPGEPTTSCLFTVRLTYVVSGLARGAYRVHASPARVIDVAP